MITEDPMRSRYLTGLTVILLVSFVLPASSPLAAESGDLAGTVEAASISCTSTTKDYPDNARTPSVFDDGAAVTLRKYRSSETLRLQGKRMDSPSVSVSEMLAARHASGSSRLRPGAKKKIALSVLSSALLPGLGELYLYFDSGSRSALLRAPVFMALDAYFWYGYKTNYDKGKDYKAEYEAYCDEHWSEEKFLEQHPVCIGLGGCTDWEEYNAEGQGFVEFFFIYMPKSMDREEYYENCGKYDAFAFGWDDWNQWDEGWDGSYETFEPWTPHRTEYWALRDESDKYLVRADQHIMMAIVNRVVSMIDAAWLAYSLNRSGADDSAWSVDFTPGPYASNIGVSYRF